MGWDENFAIQIGANGVYLYIEWDASMYGYFWDVSERHILVTIEG